MWSDTSATMTALPKATFTSATDGMFLLAAISLSEQSHLFCAEAPQSATIRVAVEPFLKLLWRSVISEDFSIDVDLLVLNCSGVNT